MLAAAVALAAAFAPAAMAQNKVLLRISTPAVPDDWHGKMWTVFKESLDKSAPGEFDVQINLNATLFKQGTEPAAMARVRRWCESYPRAVEKFRDADGRLRELVRARATVRPRLGALAEAIVKSLREGKVSLKESFARFKGSELFLVGLHIAPYVAGNIWNHPPRRPRKLRSRSPAFQASRDRPASPPTAPRWRSTGTGRTRTTRTST